jgi:hypothetical protein
MVAFLSETRLNCGGRVAEFFGQFSERFDRSGRQCHMQILGTVLLLVLVFALGSCENRENSKPVVQTPSKIVVSKDRPAYGRFTTPLRLGPRGCERNGRCTLVSDLNFYDRRQGLEWSAAARGETDGASIPKVFRPFIGSPFDPVYLRAAVLHDHYCKEERRVRNFLQTHRVFYNAMMAIGVEKSKALTMYYAVLVGGPKWFKLVPGEVCGSVCVRDAQLESLGIRYLDDGYVVGKPAQYDDPEIRRKMKEGAEFIRARGTDISLEELDRKAQAASPDDPFLQNLGKEKISKNDLLLRM